MGRLITPFAPWLSRLSEWTVAHAARCSQRGQRRRQRGYRYANHRLPKTVLFHMLLMFNYTFPFLTKTLKTVFIMLVSQE